MKSGRGRPFPWGMQASTTSIATPLDAKTRGGDAVRDRVAERLREGALDLPILPDVVQRVIAAASDRRTDGRKIADLVRGDPAVASHVLRVANSPLFRPVSPIVSLQHAVSRLGVNTLRDILLLVALERQAARAPGRAAELRAELQLAVTSAIFAQELARARRSNVEGAFLAGLLHDVGRHVALEAAALVAGELGVALSAEEELDIVDDLHTEVGARLVLDWGLPSDVAEGVRHHHRPLQTPETPALAALLAVADACARFALGIDARELEVTRHPALSALDLYPDDVAAILARRAALLEQARGTR